VSPGIINKISDMIAGTAKISKTVGYFLLCNSNKITENNKAYGCTSKLKSPNEIYGNRQDTQAKTPMHIL
jgi:hypothetical protein